MPEFDLLMPAGSRVQRLENIPTSQQLALKGSYQAHSSKLASILSLDFSASQNKSKQFSGEELIGVQNHSFKTGVKWTGNFSRRFNPKMSWTSMWQRTAFQKGFREPHHRQNQDVQIGLDWLLQRRLEIRSDNTLKWIQRRPALLLEDDMGFINNLSLRYLFDEKGNISLSLNAYDLLDRTPRMATSIASDFNRTTYQYYLGRHLMLGFKWRI